MEKKSSLFIGVDGGGTKTVGVLADEKGKILRKIKVGPSNPNKIGFEKAILNLRKLISKLSKGKENKIKVAFLGLAGGLERNKEKREKIQKELQKFFKFKILVDGDQKIAFFAGTNEKDGVVVIAGTGAIAMGWKREKEAIAGGWDWLIGDQGSGFWVGRKVLEEIAKSIDGRGEKIKIKKVVFKKFKIKKEKDVYEKFYCEDFVEKVASISKIVDWLSRKGDKFSKKILLEAARELFKMAISVIKKLNFKKEKFPLVLVGGMFKSKIFCQEFKRLIKKVAPRAKFIFLKREPVIGAVKLALESAK